MLIFSKIVDIQRFLKEIKSQKQSVGFVPTMGALHKGHISLIEASKKVCNITICSIFVNPTQFNDKGDLERYPRMPEKDTLLLEEANCDVLFLPPINEIYPKKDETTFDFGFLDKTLEGKHRPGHFNGVAQVVKRLLEIIEPNKAFFGSKDFQQVMIVKALIKQMNSTIEIIACPILREADGLAMSSRNALLSSQEREIAALVPKLMNEAKNIVKKDGITTAKLFIQQETNKISLMKLDYFEICNAGTLEEMTDLKSGKKAIALIALFVGKIRLIDNLEIT
ncbi:MAG: pantoate--beta-alanine ligase [Bacteroidota bacterium]|nr:pantoate--beta-alanine ligase [Bacteroidota bacterium]MDP3145031.1 pantoate--beta-alanine ligase [Bacteroidota bacterium]